MKNGNGKFRLTKEDEAELRDMGRSITESARMWKKRFCHIPSEPKDAARYLAKRTKRFAGEYCEARDCAGTSALSDVIFRRHIPSKDAHCLLSAGFHFSDAVRRKLPYKSAVALSWAVSILLNRGCSAREVLRAVEGILDMQASIHVRKALGLDKDFRRRIARAMKATTRKDSGAGIPE
jgi:hypothetical protein